MFVMFSRWRKEGIKVETCRNGGLGYATLHASSVEHFARPSGFMKVVRAGREPENFQVPNLRDVILILRRLL